MSVRINPRVLELNEEEVLYYCSAPEDDFFDRKAFGVKGDKIQKIAVAFANADGGEFLIGIKDDGDEEDPIKRWVGRDRIEDFNGALQALSEVRPAIDFRHEFLKRPSMSATYVLKITVNKGLTVHYTAGEEVFIRRGASSQRLKSPTQIMELSHAKGHQSAEDLNAPDADTDEIVYGEALGGYLDQLPIKNKDPLDFLLQENLIDRETFIPKVSAVLLFSECPAQSLPRHCSIRLAKYDTKEEETRDTLVSNQVIEGSLYDLINKAYEKITETLSENSAWTLEGYRPISYPKETIWEILVNAVIHRDYLISDNVLVSVFNNRIQFKSPGRFPGFVTKDNILENRFSRNSKLVRLLAKYRNAPNQDMGEGMNTAFEKMAERGLKLPVISEHENYVVVSLYHTPSLAPDEVVQTFIDRFGTINNMQVRDLLGLEKSEQATGILTKLRTQGLIKRKDTSTGINALWEKA
ncbi:RNA-binding domain-containing protein [Pseudomonas sp. B22(2017)]|uniref:RNA-binding domain-containing protein n=1 Tax=Pseudomonas sp. B22(2017) TaxID=1981736 RepID=UPI0021145F90|nr:RNA-binding domain-containing protein [Pseudomonas sp. B22(2017)]